MLANFQWFEPIPGSTGKPSPLYDIQLVDADGNLCEDGEEGTIAVMDVKHNPPTGLLTGYFKNPEMTEEKLGGAYYDTGDVAWRDSDGYYWFVGRNDDVIKCSGYRIGPFEVESALLEHPAVVECAITGAPDPIRGQVVKATIVLAKGYEGTPELTKELQNHVKHATAPISIPGSSSMWTSCQRPSAARSSAPRSANPTVRDRAGTFAAQCLGSQVAARDRAGQDAVLVPGGDRSGPTEAAAETSRFRGFSERG